VCKNKGVLYTYITDAFTIASTADDCAN